MAADPEHAALETAELELRSPSDTLAVERPSFTGYPFTLGVASGSPFTTGVVLWTRLAPEPLGGGGAGPDAIVVRWELAEDEGFGRIVQSGSVDAVPAWGHSVHVPVAGLAPGHWYFYRFMAGDEVSPVGRTRTAPPVDRRGAAAAFRAGLVPALRARLLRRAPPPARRRPGPGRLRRRLHLRVRGPRRRRAPPRRRRDAHACAVPQPARAVQDRPGFAAPSRGRPVAAHVG